MAHSPHLQRGRPGARCVMQPAAAGQRPLLRALAFAAAWALLHAAWAGCLAGAPACVTALCPRLGAWRPCSRLSR